MFTSSGFATELATLSVVQLISASATGIHVESLVQVLSQVLVPPLAQEYVMVREEWMKQKLWQQEPFVEVLNPGSDEKMTAKTVKAVHQFLEM